MREGSPTHTKQIIGLLVVILFVIGGYYYIEKKNVQVSNHIPIHGELVALFIGDIELQVEVVGTDEAMKRGLSGRETLLESNGMFFLFTHNDFHGIWMKDMLFPIDIVWIDENLSIVTIERDATPDSFPYVFRSTYISRYVLEVPSGLTEELGIKIGDRVRF